MPASRRPSGLVPIAASLILACLLLVPSAAAQDASIEILSAPDVVVTTDFEGEEYTSPRYTWSLQAKVTNGDNARRMTLHTVTYLDQETTGCPEQQHGVRPVHKFSKNVELDPGQSITVGGVDRPSGGDRDHYWPMEVFYEYPDPNGGSINYSQGEHTFCVLIQVTGNDPACDKSEHQVCTLAKDSTRIFVRDTNDAPWVKALTLAPEDPGPGDQVLLRVDAEDNDTVPRQDQLSYTWDLGPETKEGPVIRHTWNTPGTKGIELTVTDGHETVTIERNITIAAGQVGDGGSGNGTPGPGAVAVLIVTMAAALVARRRW